MEFPGKMYKCRVQFQCLSGMKEVNYKHLDEPLGEGRNVFGQGTS